MMVLKTTEAAEADHSVQGALKSGFCAYLLPGNEPPITKVADQ